MLTVKTCLKRTFFIVWTNYGNHSFHKMTIVWETCFSWNDHRSFCMVISWLNWFHKHHIWHFMIYMFFVWWSTRVRKFFRRIGSLGSCATCNKISGIHFFGFENIAWKVWKFGTILFFIANFLMEKVVQWRKFHKCTQNILPRHWATPLDKKFEKIILSVRFYYHRNIFAKNVEKISYF